MTENADAIAYYEEEITIQLSRITLLSIIGACVLATKHPDYTGPAADLVKNAIRQLAPLVCRYAPQGTLAEWLSLSRPS